MNPANPNRLPLNTLQHARQLADHNSRWVTAPNNDTLYSSANLDLRSGPVRIDVPDFGSRYYSIALVDAFTNNFAYIGKRTTGTHAGSYLVAGPGWNFASSSNASPKVPASTLLPATSDCAGQLIVDVRSSASSGTGFA